MLSRLIFFREVLISLVNLILVTVIRYQDHLLRKILLPTHPRGFSRGNKINAYSFKQGWDFNDKHWHIMNYNHNGYGNAKEQHLLRLCPPVTPALSRFTGKSTSRNLVHSRVTLRENMARTAPTISQGADGDTTTLQQNPASASSFVSLKNFLSHWGSVPETLLLDHCGIRQA